MGKQIVFDPEWIRSVRMLAPEIDRAKDVPATLRTQLHELKLFKMFVPEELGGLMLTLPEAARAFEAASRIEGNIGWLAAIGAGGGFFAKFMEPRTAEQVFGPSDALIAGSGKPSGTAVPTDGGYVVSGRWAYCSGAEQATCFTANAWIEGAEGRDMLAFAFKPEQIEIERDWNAFGLRATGSHTIVANQAFVPHERTFHLERPHDRYDGAIYSVPFMPFAAVSFAAVSAGIAEHLLDEAERAAESRREEWQSSSQGRYVALIKRLQAASVRFAAAKDEFDRSLEDAWAKHAAHDEAAIAAWDEVTLASKRLAQAAHACGAGLIPLLGMRAVMEDEPVNKLWRDLQTVCQHAALSPSE